MSHTPVFTTGPVAGVRPRIGTAIENTTPRTATAAVADAPAGPDVALHADRAPAARTMTEQVRRTVTPIVGEAAARDYLAATHSLPGESTVLASETLDQIYAGQPTARTSFMISDEAFTAFKAGGQTEMRPVNVASAHAVTAFTNPINHIDDGAIRVPAFA